ncbi:MAG: hypothetical protein J2P37_10710, partial [Ktedonobacteraceae bacterium]|nr:hypothetical protein [Ktedonobacteraceae bacterium]
DAQLLREETLTILVQINGRVRDQFTVAHATPEEEIRSRAFSSPRVQRTLNGQPPRRVIYIPNRLINIVTG